MDVASSKGCFEKPNFAGVMTGPFPIKFPREQKLIKGAVPGDNRAVSFLGRKVRKSRKYRQEHPVFPALPFTPDFDLTRSFPRHTLPANRSLKMGNLERIEYVQSIGCLANLYR